MLAFSCPLPDFAHQGAGFSRRWFGAAGSTCPVFLACGADFSPFIGIGWETTPPAVSLCFMRNLTCLLLAVLGFATPLFSQAPVSGVLKGRVLDPEGLVVEGVTVSLTKHTGGAPGLVRTGPAGTFEFTRISPGHFSLSATKDGFATTTAPDIAIAVNETTNVDLILRLGKISDGVTVNDVVHIVETDRSSISGRVDERRVRTLPLNGENFARLVLLAPGIAGGSPNNPSVSGSRPVANSYGIDGVSANDERGSNGLSLGGGGAAEFSAFSPNLISTEAVQEFSITTSGADAAFGRGSGGQINIVTKSGGNAWHGSAYEYFRNNKLDARDFFNNGPFFAKDTPRRSVVPPFK